MSNTSENKIDEIKSNVTQLMTAYSKLNSLLSNRDWITKANIEDIKTTFKLGVFVEKLTRHLSSQDALEDFLEIFSAQDNNNNSNRNINYFNACDSLLKIFFRAENISEATLDIVIRIYTTMFPKDRLQSVLCDLIKYSNQSGCLAHYINSLPKEKAAEFEFYLHLKNWKYVIQVDKSNFESELKEKLSYNVDENLNIILGIMSLKNISHEDKVIQSSILGIILEKMLDRSILSSCFWYAIIQKSNLDILCSVCENFKDFKISVLNFIIYLGCMMEKIGDSWKSDSSKSLCAEISYYDLLIIIKNIAQFDHTFVFDKLNEARVDTGAEIWDEMKNEMCAMFKSQNIVFR